MKNKKHFIIFILVLAINAGMQNLIAQVFTIDNAALVIKSKGNLTFPAWSEDGKTIFYQSDENGNYDIFAFNINNKSVKQITNSKADEQHPAWWTNNNAVVFDMKNEGSDFLYCYSFTKNKILPLFNRNISCRQPSFDPDGRLVAFSGYDRETERWQVFTYDFVYDNLNRLTTNTHKSVFPVFSPKGNKIIYQQTDNINDTTGKIYMINWYGKKILDFDENAVLKTVFTPDEWRIYFVETVKGGCRLKSMRKDGSSIVDVSAIYPAICCPSFSPDKTKLAVAIKTGNKYEIYIFKLEQ